MLAHLKTSKTLTYIPDIAELPGGVQVPCQVGPGLKPELGTDSLTFLCRRMVLVGWAWVEGVSLSRTWARNWTVNSGSREAWLQIQHYFLFVFFKTGS